jgi:hypothetical protein
MNLEDELNLEEESSGFDARVYLRSWRYSSHVPFAHKVTTTSVVCHTTCHGWVSVLFTLGVAGNEKKQWFPSCKTAMFPKKSLVGEGPTGWRYTPYSEGGVYSVLFTLTPTPHESSTVNSA